MGKVLKNHQIEQQKLMLNEFLYWYFNTIDSMTFEMIREHQEAPWASLTDGASAQAYTLIHGANGSTSIDRLHKAENWLAITGNAYKERDAFYYPGVPGDQGLSSSLYGSVDSIRYLQLLIHCKLANDDSFQKALPMFLEQCCGKISSVPTEVMFGIAGYLNATVNLFRYTRDSRILTVADQLAQTLLDRGKPGRNRGWIHDKTLNFSHGRSGTYHSLLSWSHFAIRDLPAWFFDELTDLAEVIENNGEIGVSETLPHTLRRSWCKGSAGHAMLWSRAFEQSGDKKYLHLAWKAASFAYTGKNNSAGNNALCCGLGGRSYALLAVDRIAPGSGWYERAIELATLAIRQAPGTTSFFSQGLYRGHGGLVCLARDLLSEPPDRVGYPLIEG